MLLDLFWYYTRQEATQLKICHFRVPAYRDFTQYWTKKKIGKYAG